MAKSVRKTSASFSTIITLILVISTVIIFTVLLFLSYESILTKNERNARDTVVRTSNVLARTFTDTIITSDDPETVTDKTYAVFTRFMTVNAENYPGGVYLCTEDGYIISSYRPDEDFSMTDVTIANAGNPVSSKYSEGKTFISCASKLDNYKIYIVCEITVDRDSALQEFESVILLPAMICILIAIILFVFAIQLTFSPVREMSKTIKKVSEGDYSVRVDKRYTDKSDLRNVTSAGDIVTMAETLNEMIDKLENAENDRQIFISSIAHDIRTPLTSINGFVTAIMDGTIPPENMDKYLALIKQEINRIRELVVSMTEASSLSHVDPDVMERFPLNDVVRDVVENLQPQLSEKNITCEVRLSDAPEASECYGEAQQLCRVIVNIITNAIKFTPKDGTIIVSTEPNKSEKNVKISVEDSGIGIPEEKRNRIFESFYKVDSSRTKEGFGLGLYICKQILSGHGQTIYVEEGKELGGAKFVFTFPMPEDTWDLI